MKYIIFQINGGAGKCVMATAVCKAIKTAYPDYKLIVFSGHSEIFINNPYVEKTLQFGGVSYFYQDYIKDKECKVFLHDPYLDNAFVSQDKHLIKVWSEMFDIPYNNEMPELYLTQREIEFYQRNINLDKPILLLQTNGGGDANVKYSWARDLPSCNVVDVINHFKDKYAICHIRRQDQQEYRDTYSISASYREIMAFTLMSSKRLLIDSMVQHFAAAFKMPSVVCWVSNKPAVFGYDLHTNIQANPFTTKPDLRNAFLTEFNIGGDASEFAYNSENEIFDTNKIITALESIK
jgi:hypothetical protein